MPHTVDLVPTFFCLFCITLDVLRACMESERGMVTVKLLMGKPVLDCLGSKQDAFSFSGFIVNVSRWVHFVQAHFIGCR